MPPKTVSLSKGALDGTIDLFAADSNYVNDAECLSGHAAAKKIFYNFILSNKASIFVLLNK